jgi:putative membrane protein
MASFFNTLDIILMPRKLTDYFLLFLKGLAMGSADVIPGVSGGTIAFITGIYEELLDTIKAFDLTALKLLTGFKIKELWRYINGNFLVALLAGIGLSIIIFAQVITHLLELYPIYVWSFFFGLIIISSITIARQIKRWSPGVIFAFIAGLVSAYIIVSSTPATTPTSWWFIILSGMIAITAMILPGISGSFILLIMGKYEYVLRALKELNYLVIALFAAGCVIGLLSFSRAISWFLKKYHNMAIGLLSGFMVGSLYKIWPWKRVVQFRLNSAGEQVPFIESNVWPHYYHKLTGQDPQILFALLFIALGFGVVVIIEKIAHTTVKYKNK